MAQLIIASKMAGLELELFTDTQFTTAYLDGKPVATVRRKHAFDARNAPNWQAWDTFGGDLGHSWAPGTIVRLVEHYAGKLAAAKAMSTAHLAPRAEG